MCDITVTDHQLIFSFVVAIFVALVVIVLSIDKFNLMCSSNNLIEAIQNPTVFCMITGTQLAIH